MWTRVPLDNGKPSWGIEQGMVTVSIASIEDMTNEEIGLCVRALAPFAEKIDPYLQRGMHFPTIHHFDLFYEAEQKARVEKELQRKKREVIRRELARMYEEVYLFLASRDGLYCQICEGITNLQIDHVTPVSKGGTNDRTNLQLLCRDCNRKKRDH